MFIGALLFSSNYWSYDQISIRAWIVLVYEKAAMKRTKQWWAVLTKYERRELVYLERGDRHSSYSSYYPDDCVECGSCGNPSLGSGLCPLCRNRLTDLLDKANQGVPNAS